MEEASNDPIVEFRELGGYTFDLREGDEKYVVEKSMSSR